MMTGQRERNRAHAGSSNMVDDCSQMRSPGCRRNTAAEGGDVCRVSDRISPLCESGPVLPEVLYNKNIKYSSGRLPLERLKRMLWWRGFQSVGVFAYLKHVFFLAPAQVSI